MAKNRSSFGAAASKGLKESYENHFSSDISVSKMENAAPPDDEACGCNNCRYMKMITLENIFTTLRDERPEISLDEEVRRRAERSILNMIAIK